jgi:putative peptidoglycan lipid II flippase
MVFSGLTLVSRFLGLARDLVITARMGASQTIAADAFFTAQAFSNLFRRVFAEGAFAAAFVPAYSRTLSAEGGPEADRLASDALAVMAVATVALTLVAQLAMPWIMLVYSPGYIDDPAKFRLAVILTQITMPYLPCMVIAALLAGVLTARGRFIIYGAYPVVLNIGVLAAVLPQTDPVDAAYAASWATIVSGIAQAGLCWWGVRRAGARIRLVRPRLTPEVRRLVRLTIPGAVASSAVQVNIFISTMLASHVAGLRVWMSVADRFYQLPLSLVGTAIGVALLPQLSRAFAGEDAREGQAVMDQALVFGLALCLPAAAALVAMPVYLVDGLFTRGQFVFEDARASGLILLQYGWGLPAFVLVKILQPAFFARQDTRTPMVFSLVSVAVNIVLGVALFHLIGFTGLAAATSIATWITVAQMAYALGRQKAYAPSAEAWSRIARIIAASVGMGLLLALAAHYRTALEAPLAGVSLLGLGAKELTVLWVCLAGALAYAGLLLAFGGLRMSDVRAALRRTPSAPSPPAPDLS